MASRKPMASMSLGQPRPFARGSMAGKPEHVKKKHNPIANLGKHAHPKKGRR